MKKVDKPWGYEEIFAKTDKYVGKILFIKAGHKLSLQYHKVKEETIRIMSGEMRLILEEGGKLVEKRMGVGEVEHIRPKVIHRMIGETDCMVIEVSTPELEDVVRLEDEYGR